MRFGRAKSFLLSALCVALLLLPQGARAEEETAEARLSDIIITASRTEQEVKETPATAEIITRGDLDKLGAKNLGEALALSTGIDLVSPAMAGRSVSVRGMSTRHVLILVDGKRMISEGSHSTANSHELDRINIDNVERVEIVRGPVSSIYGSEGMSGVINVITRKPEKRQITLSASPWIYNKPGGVGGQDYFLRYDNGKSDNFSWLASYGRNNISAHGNPDMGTGDYHNSSNNQYGYRDIINFEGTYNLGGNQYLDFSAGWEKERFKGRSSTTQFERYYNERRQFSVAWRGSTERSSYQIRTYYGEHDKNNPVYNYEGGTMNDFDKSKRTAWVVEGHVSTQLGENHLLTYGGEFRTEDYWGTMVGDSSSTGSASYGGMSKTAGDFSMDSHAFYVQDEWLINDRLLIIPSLRYDNSDRFSDNFSPKLGITYKLSGNYRLKANFGKSFKAPALDDMFMRMAKRMGGFMVTVNGNPNLKPEESTSYELSLEGENGRNFGKITYFINDVKNLITASNTTAFIPGVGMSVTSTYYNEDTADIDGIELELGRHLSDFFTLKLNYTWLDATGTDGQRLTGRSKRRGTVQLHYDDGRAQGISAVLWLDWNSRYLSYITNSNEDFCTLNIAVNKRWSETVSAFFGIDNVFNMKNDPLNIYGAIFKAGVTMTL